MVMMMVLVLAACTGRPPVPLRLVPVSPAGEVLGAPSRQPEPYRQAMAGWFARADANADGLLDPAEVTADADRAFAAYDLNRDGSVTSAELTEYRIASPHQPPQRPPSSRIRPDTRATAEHVESAPADASGPDLILRSGLDPVMSADANANFQVTREELRTLARARLARWDTDGDRRVSLTEFLEGNLSPLRAMGGW